MDRQQTPKRWKGLGEPTRITHRPYAARRMSGLDGLEYRAMAIPKSENSYIIPPRRRNKTSPIPAKSQQQPPVKKTRLDEEGASGVGLNASMMMKLSLDGEPEKKKVRFHESEMSAAYYESLSSSESNGDTTQTTTTSTQPQEETTADYVAAKDVTNLTFDSLVFKRLKELCQEQEISVPKGAKKKDDLVALLADKISCANVILDEEPYSSFTKEALEVKCRDLNLFDTGSKSKLIERLEAFSNSD